MTNRGVLYIRFEADLDKHNSIEEWKEYCIDMLSGHGHFDEKVQIVSSTTQTREDRQHRVVDNRPPEYKVGI